MNLHAEGSFDVKNTPLAPDDSTAGTGIGRFGLDKQYRGDLEGAAKGIMLGFGNPAQGAAGYVAIEQITGTLQGRSGSFALQHSGQMQPGVFELDVRVVPGSGTGQLEGIGGSATFDNASGSHSYKIDYSLPDAP
jgi:hypothetical protein